LKAGDTKYSEKMLEALRAIAPVKRAGLDFAYLKSDFIKILAHKDNLLLMEEGLELVDLSWREILKSFDLELQVLEVDYALKEKKDHLESRIKPGPYSVKNFSASRLQSFLDCPRKYYFAYIERVDHRPEERLIIAPDEMGTIEHSIIEAYFANTQLESTIAFDIKKLEIITREALEEFLENTKIILSEKTKLTTFFELLHYSQNGIEYIIDFCKKNLATNIEFEKSLGENPWHLIGSIDCVIHLPDNHISLLDFKRSSAAVGSKKETLEFEKIQIWIYLLMMNKFHEKKIHSWGYLNLAETDESQIYDEFKTPHLSEEVLNAFQVHLLETIHNVKNETAFRAKPRNSKICNFCEVQLFCNKGSAN
jgi:RecB family exonuclease